MGPNMIARMRARPIAPRGPDTVGLATTTVSRHREPVSSCTCEEKDDDANDDENDSVGDYCGAERFPPTVQDDDKEEEVLVLGGPRL